MDAKQILDFIEKNDIQFEESNRGDHKVRKLAKFQDVQLENDYRSQFKTFTGLLKDNLSSILVSSSSTIMVTIGYFFLSRTTDLKLQSAMGISVTYFKFFHGAFTTSVGEKMGINCSREYGGKFYQSMINTLYKGIVMQIVYMILVTIPSFIYSDKLLAVFIDDSEVCSMVQNILVWSIPVAILQSINITVRNYVQAQGIESIYGPYTLFSVFLSTFMAWIFLSELKMGIKGWILFRLFFELLKMIFNLFVVISKIDPNTLGPLDLNLLKQTISFFMFHSFVFSMCYYLEFIGLEVSIFFVGNVKDYREIVAYVSFMNFLRLALSIGKGFSVILRTRINLLIGMLSQNAAENFFWFFYMSLLISGTILGLFTALLSSPIAHIYTVEPDIHDLISKMVFTGSFLLGFVISLDSVSTALRSLWMTGNLILIYIFILIFFNTVLGWNLMHRFEMFAYGFCISGAFSATITNLSCLFVLSTFDWSEVETKYKEYKKYSEIIRRLKNLYKGKNNSRKDNGIRFSTNGVPIELLIVNSNEVEIQRAEVSTPKRGKSREEIEGKEQLIPDTERQ